MIPAARESFAAARKRLPYDAEVQYLQSSGTQYIDTGFTPSANAGMMLDFAPIQRGGTTVVAGSRTSGTNTRFWVNPSVAISSQPLMACGFGDVYTFDGVNYSLGVRYQVAVNYLASGYAEFLGHHVSLSTFAGNPWSVYLFAANVSGTATFAATSTARIYGAAISRGGILVRDFIPVRKGGVGYMYDRISGRLFGNAGTGAFTIGPDKTA